MFSGSKSKYLVFTILLLTLGGCAAPYKKVGGFLYGDLGYSDEMLAQNEFKIKYFGREWDDISQLKKLWHKRAGQLCPQGYTNSELKRKVDKKLEFDQFFIHTNRFPYVEGIAYCTKL